MPIDPLAFQQQQQQFMNGMPGAHTQGEGPEGQGVTCISSSSL